MVKKYMTVRFSDNKTFKFPAEIVAASYAEYQSSLPPEAQHSNMRGKSYQEFYDYVMDPKLFNSLRRWACGSMDWADVVSHAVEIPSKPIITDYKAEWCNAEFEVIE